MRLLERKTFTAFASLAACLILWCADGAKGNINIELRPGVNTAVPNANVNIGLYLVSDSAISQFSIAADVVFTWNNTRLQFLGIDGTGGASVSASFLPADNNLNEVVPPQDGTGFYQMLGNFGSPVAATPAGTLITTFRFKALSTSCTGANFTIAPSGGNPVRNTRVLSGIVPNLNVTGTLGSSLVFIDGVAPVINACAPAQMIPAGASCQGIMPDLTGLLTITDNCTNLTITQTPLAGTLLALGPQAVVIQVKDPGNNITSCNTSVTVVDQTGPIISQCAASQSVPANANCQAAIPNLTGQVIASDACSPPVTITQSPTVGTLVGLGPTVVTISVKDAVLNTTTCQATITVEDQSAPQITTCPGAQTIAADSSCQAAIPDLTGAIVANDNCTPTPSLVISQSPTAGTLVGPGPTVVTLSVKDAALNTATCQATITVADQTAPQITTCPGAQTIAADASCQAQIPNLTGAVVASDNCTLTPSLAITQLPPAGTLVGPGPTVVTISVKDAALNTATCQATITVADQTAPQITTCPGAQMIAADASCQAAIPDLTGAVVANDNCTPTPSLVISQSPTAGTLVGPGPTVVTLSVKDAALNTATCQATVTVADQTAPQITTCPGAQTIAADASCQAQIPNLTGSVVANDNCTPAPSLVITQSPLAGTIVGPGPHIVTFTVKDAALNQATCQATITVEDQTDPTISQCAPPQTIAANGACQAALPNLTGLVVASDNCTPTPALVISQSPAAGTLVGMGPTVVTLSVKDAALNETTCQATVTIEDQTAPTISQCASAQTVGADANQQAPIPDLTPQVIATDACSNPVIITQSPTAGTIVGLGPHTVTLSATDAANNTSTCQAVVTVADQTDPVISQCAPSPTLAADANCQAQIPDLTAQVIATDIISPPVIVTQSPAAGTLVGIGPHTVTFTATDAANNSSTCDAVVTVEDQTAPNITQCAGPQTLPADANCQAAIPNLTGGVIAMDLCSNPVTITQSPAAGTLVGIGPHNVTLTAEDAAGNESTCIAVITVEDQTDPVISQCAGPQTLPANGTCQAQIPDLTGGVIATDVCSLPVTISQSPAAGTLVGIGPHNVTITVEDSVGNDTTCVAVVTVEDQTDPTISQCAGSPTLAADANCEAQIPNLTVGVIATDVCSLPVTISQSPAAGTLVGIGPHNVTITVEDAVGNDATCIAVVTVEDQSDPVISQCAGPQTLAADANCQAAIPNLTGGVIATDACSLQVTIDQSPAAGTLVGIGPHNVTITVEDAAGNDATCVAVVTVTDQTNPQITTCPGNQLIAAGPTCQAALPDLTAGVVATDNCTPSGSLAITQSPTAGTVVGLGPTVVTITVTDAALNSVTCQATITVADQTAPVLTPCPANIVTNTNAGSCSAVVSWTPPTATDNCGTPTVTRTQGPAPGSTFASNSTTTIEYTATDAANNTITCSFTVTVTPSPDMDNDGDVDPNDIPIFVNVLLGLDTDPVRVARADVNCDGSVNGRDVQPFVDILTP